MAEKNTTATENWICSNCGGTFKWNIAKQQFECASCRTPQKIKSTIKAVKEHDYNNYLALEDKEVSFPDETIIHCQTCGAEIAFFKSETAKTCPMCSSTHVAAQKQNAGVPPDGVIPFYISKDEAQERFHKWVKSRWFAPNKLKKAYQQGRLDGIYIPFWTFDAKVDAMFDGRGGKYYKAKDGNGETKVKWKNVTGEVSGSFDDLAVCASQHRISEVIDEILPFSTQKKSRPFSSAYLSGFGAERYAIPANEAVKTAKATMKSEMKSKAEANITGSMNYDVSDVQKIKLTYNELLYKQILVPVWASAFSYSNKQYLYLINGENGEVGGQRPYSAPKIITAILVVILIFFLGIQLFSGEKETTETSSAYSTTYTAYESTAADVIPNDFTIS